MRRSAPPAAVLLLLASLAAAPAFADGALAVRNEEDLVFHWVLDPPGLSGAETNTLGFRMRLLDWFLQESDDWAFTALAPRGTAEVGGLAAGRHLLIGFFERKDSLDHPVGLWEVEVPDGGAAVTRPVGRQGAVLTVRTGEGKLADLARRGPGGTDAATDAAGTGAGGGEEAAIRLDERYEDWEAVPALAAFSGFYEPASFTRQGARGWEALPLGEARWWKTGGTQLNEVKALADDGDIWFFASTQSALTGRLSLFLYFHDRATEQERNRVTLEVCPGEAGLPGVVLLWQRRAGISPRPEAVGRLVSGSFFLEGRISRRMVEAALGREIGPEAFFDLTTCHFDRGSGTYEEFYFTTVYLRDIPSR